MELPISTRFVSIDAEDRAGYVQFRFSGKYNFPDFSAIILGLREECARRGCTRAFIDMEAVEGDIPGIERYDLGLRFAEAWGGKMRVAILFGVVPSLLFGPMHGSIEELTRSLASAYETLYATVPAVQTVQLP